MSPGLSQCWHSVPCPGLGEQASSLGWSRSPLIFPAIFLIQFQISTNFQFSRALFELRGTRWETGIGLSVDTKVQSPLPSLKLLVHVTQIQRKRLKLTQRRICK